LYSTSKVKLLQLLPPEPVAPERSIVSESQGPRLEGKEPLTNGACKLDGVVTVTVAAVE
jgi:hypothetical protein